MNKKKFIIVLSTIISFFILLVGSIIFVVNIINSESISNKEVLEIKDNDIIRVDANDQVKYSYSPKYSGLYDVNLSNSYTDMYLNNEKITAENSNQYLNCYENYELSFDTDNKNYVRELIFDPVLYNGEIINIASCDRYICKIKGNAAYNDIRFNGASITIFNEFMTKLDISDSIGSGVCYLEDAYYYVLITNRNVHEISDILTINKITNEIENSKEYHLKKGNNAFLICPSDLVYGIRVSCALIHIIDNKFVNKNFSTSTDDYNVKYGLFYNHVSDMICVNIFIDEENDYNISICEFFQRKYLIVNGEKINVDSDLYMLPNEEYNISLVDNFNNTYEFSYPPIIIEKEKSNNIYMTNPNIDFDKYYDEDGWMDAYMNHYLKVWVLPHGVPHLNFEVKDGMLTVDKYGKYNINVVGALFDSNGKIYSHINLNEGSIPLNIDSNSSFVFKIEYIEIHCFKYENYINQNIYIGQFHFDDIIISNNN